MPAEALAAGGDFASFQFDTVGVTTVDAGDWSVEVTATLHAAWSSTQLAYGTFVIE